MSNPKTSMSNPMSFTFSRPHNPLIQSSAKPPQPRLVSWPVTNISTHVPRIHAFHNASKWSQALASSWHSCAIYWVTSKWLITYWMSLIALKFSWFKTGPFLSCCKNTNQDTGTSSANKKSSNNSLWRKQVTSRRKLHCSYQFPCKEGCCIDFQKQNSLIRVKSYWPSCDVIQSCYYSKYIDYTATHVAVVSDKPWVGHPLKHRSRKTLAKSQEACPKALTDSISSLSVGVGTVKICT